MSCPPDEGSKQVVQDGPLQRSCILKCLRCKCLNDNVSGGSGEELGLGRIRGLNWLCDSCYNIVELEGDEEDRVERETGNEDRHERERDEITLSVMKKLTSYVDVLADKIVGKLEGNGSLDSSRGSMVGERSFADVVRKPAAKIVISNAGDSFISDASEALKETPVSFMKADKSGNVTIGLPDEDILNSARGRLRDIIPASADTKTLIKLPKVTVRDFPVPTKASSGGTNRREIDSEIISQIRMKNREIKTLIDEGHTCEVVYVGKPRGGDRASIGLRVSCSIKDFLLSRGNLFVGNVSCRVEERHYIPQCYMCQRFGHKAYECEQEAPTCMHCAGHHSSRDCDNRRNKCCSNCKASSDPQIQSGAVYHNAASTDCPVYLRRLRIQKN